MKIRNARDKDIITCVDVKRDSESTRIEYSKKNEMLTRTYFQRYLSDEYSTFLVVEDNSNILGYVVFSYDEWNNSIHIDQIFVRLYKQNKGVGSKLLNAVFDRAKKIGVRIVFLETGKTNNDAMRFYEKNGFSIAGHINNLYEESPGDALILSRKLK